MPEEVIETQDTEVQDACLEITAVMEAAYDLLLGRREAALAAVMSPLDVEETRLRQEYAGIAEARQNLEIVLSARAREAQRQADALLLDGKHEEARAKLAESEEARQAPENMKRRQTEIHARIEAIEGEKKTLAKNAFQAWYREVRQIIGATEAGLFIGLLDKSRDEMYSFQARRDLGPTLEKPFGGLVQSQLLDGLTSAENTATWKSGHLWYRGRR